MRDVLDLHRAYARVFGTSDGARVLDDLARRGGENATSFSSDALRMAFNEGRRFMVLHVRHMVDPEKFKIFMEDDDG